MNRFTYQPIAKLFTVSLLTLLSSPLYAQDIQPSCDMCEAELISTEEISQYIEAAMLTGLTDQQLRSVDLGNTNVQLALAHRPAQAQAGPRSV
ncbi:MAG: hypothetical protein ACKVKR_00505, partial [Pseudomonadales bacterium]